MIANCRRTHWHWREKVCFKAISFRTFLPIYESYARQTVFQPDNRDRWHLVEWQTRETAMLKGILRGCAQSSAQSNCCNSSSATVIHCMQFTMSSGLGTIKLFSLLLCDCTSSIYLLCNSVLMCDMYSCHESVRLWWTMWQVMKNAKECLNLLSSKLSDKNYFFGDK